MGGKSVYKDFLYSSLHFQWKNIFSLIESAAESGRQAWLQSKPKFVLSAPMAVNNQRFLLPVLHKFQEAFPDIQVKLDQMELGETVAGIIAGTVDLSFTVYPEIIRFRSLPIQWEILGNCATYVEVPPKSGLYYRNSLQLSDLVEEPLALISSSSDVGYTEALLSIFAERGFRPQNTYYVSSAAALEMSSALGEGIVFSTDISSAKPPSSNRRIPVTDLPNGIIAFWRAGKTSSAVRSFVELTKVHLRENPL